MSDALEPLKELARRLADDGARRRIESLLPALSAAIREECRTALIAGRDEAEKRLEAEIVALKETLEQTEVSLKHEIETLKEQQCHPAACRDEMKWREVVRLERAAALWPVAEIAGGIKKYFSCVGSGEQALKFADEILALITDSDRSALEAHDVEVRDRAFQSLINKYRTEQFRNRGSDEIAAELEEAVVAELDAYVQERMDAERKVWQSRESEEYRQALLKRAVEAEKRAEKAEAETDRAVLAEARIGLDIVTVSNAVPPETRRHELLTAFRDRVKELDERIAANRAKVEKQPQK